MPESWHSRYFLSFRRCILYIYIFIYLFIYLFIIRCPTLNKVSNIIRRHIDNRKLLLTCILLLSHSLTLFRLRFLSINGCIPVYYCNLCILIVRVYVFLLLSLYPYCSSMYSYCCVCILRLGAHWQLFVAQLFSCQDGEHCFIRKRAH